MSIATRTWLRLALASAIFLIAGCANTTRDVVQIDLKSSRWQGRLALTVHTEPVQVFSAEFELQGDAQAGTLAFFTPLGSTVARLQWSDEGAYLQTSGETQHFVSLDALTLRATGAVLPIASLFAWLKGEAPETPGWQVELGDLQNGRLKAQRLAPDTPADLKIVLER